MCNGFIMETERLMLRELDTGDTKDFFLLNRDPDVVKYTGDLPFASVVAAQEFLAAYDQYRKYGYGRWAVVSKEGMEFLGWCGLKYSPDSKETDLGFRFYKKHWNKGYATETAMACTSYGLESLKLPGIIGRAAKENTASIRVLEKCGFSYVKDFDCGGMPGVYYKIENPEL